MSSRFFYGKLLFKYSSTREVRGFKKSKSPSLGFLNLTLFMFSILRFFYAYRASGKTILRGLRFNVSYSSLGKFLTPSKTLILLPDKSKSVISIIGSSKVTDWIPRILLLLRFSDLNFLQPRILLMSVIWFCDISRLTR